jgi:hypothetical protein
MTVRKTLAALIVSSLPVVLPLAGCTKMSELIEDDSVGMNGGFEQDSEGLPVNWLVYTPETVPEGDFDILFDETDFKEGRQSLKFEVRACSSTGGWHSPGIAQEYTAESAETYRVSLWIKSEGSDYRVRVGGVDAFTGEYETVASSELAAEGWQHVEHRFTMPDEFETIRFELNVLSPGTLWVDDVRIEPTGQGG